MAREKRPFKGQCRPRVCTFEIPAAVEASWRSGDPKPLRDQLLGHMRQLGRQIAEDFDAQAGKTSDAVVGEIRSPIIQ